MSKWHCQEQAAEVRLPGSADRDAWLKLWTDYHAYGAQGGSPPPSEVSDTTWVNFLNPTVPMHALLADREGRVVGFAHVVLHPTTGLVGSSGLLVDLFVEPSLHGRGIGRALMQAAVELAQAEGGVRLTWNVRPDNIPAIRLYDRLGSPSGHILYRREFDRIAGN